MDKPLWTPDETRRAATHMAEFQRFVAERHGLDLPDYAALHRWSVMHSPTFWTDLWDYATVRASTRGERALENPDAMPGARWFPDARLNFAENLLRRDDDALAIRFRNEDGRERTLTHRALRHEVALLARHLRELGVEPGDRVVGFLPNIPETVVAMLATTSLGGVWSSCSPDFGVNGVYDRFGQIGPKVLLTADAYSYNGKTHKSLPTVAKLAEKMPQLQSIVVIRHLGVGDADELAGSPSVDYGDLVAAGSAPPLEFASLPFDHPLYIMFSSGTTGQPKCIVHGAGGTLLQHLKEHKLHSDVQADDRLFFFTTCGWMMWNWLVSGLAAEATLLLYDGSPFYPDGNVLWDYAADADMAIFGTSAKYIDACSKAGIAPAKTHALPKLKAVLSTGSPLVPESFDYVYEHVGSDLCLSSMSGGTDILSCFALGNPAGPVYRGELQCLGLGMDVKAFGPDGQALPVGEKGELVCVNPFPCMPIGFFGDRDGSRYHDAYFARFEGVWCHGDFVAVTEHGGMVIYGRSDAVLNPGGVRIGTAEIYRQVEQFDEVVESLVIGQQWEGDVRVILFVRLADGVSLSDELVNRIKQHIRRETTPRHVPARVLAVDDIPRTRSGKIVELAVRKLVHDEAVDNVEALANPDALEHFRNRPELAT